MSFSDLAPPSGLSVRDRLIDARFVRRLLLINGLVPMALLAWDAANGALGVNEVDFAIHTTGMVGLVLLMLTLTVTPLRRLFGWSTIIAARRPLGLLSFLYLVLHLSIFFLLDREASVRSTIEELLSRTYLLLGAMALLMMAALACTSTDGMVRRLGARRWKRLHRLVYPIAVLGVAHFWLLVKSDTRLPRAFAVVLGALLLFRVASHYIDLRRAAASPRTPAPDAALRRRRFWSGELRVARIFIETPDVRTFRLVAAGGGPLPFEHRPGQYLNIRLSVDGRRLSRSYTIASPPSRPEACEITVRRLSSGIASSWLHDHVVEGDVLEVSAPAGRFHFTGEESDRILLIAAGVGITPIMSIVRYLTDRSWPGRIDLVLVFRTRADVIFAEELAWLERRFPNLHLAITITRPTESDAWTGLKGRLSAEMLERLVPDFKNVQVMLCGPKSMMTATREILEELGLAAEHIATEQFLSRRESKGGEERPDLSGMTEISDGVRAVSFRRSDLTVGIKPEATLLECAEESGVPIPFECRAGICGQCKTRLVSGRVVMPVQDALSRAEREDGFILMCQARPVGDVTIDA